MPRGWLVARRAWIRDHDATTYGGDGVQAGTMTGQLQLLLGPESRGTSLEHGLQPVEHDSALRLL